MKLSGSSSNSDWSLLPGGGVGDGAVEFGQQVLAVEQIGDEVLRPQRVELLLELRIAGLLAER